MSEKRNKFNQVQGLKSELELLDLEIKIHDAQLNLKFQDAMIVLKV